MLKDNIFYLLILFLFLYFSIFNPLIFSNSFIILIIMVFIVFEVLFLLVNIGSVYLKNIISFAMTYDEKIDFIKTFENISFKSDFFEVLPRHIVFNGWILYILFIVNSYIFSHFIFY